MNAFILSSPHCFMDPSHWPEEAEDMPARLSQYLDLYFEVSRRKSTLARECIAGVTTFAAMSYVIIVNPMILATTGMKQQELLLATILSATAGTLMMALWANLPVALAPGMGSNLVFAQVLVRQLGISWRMGLTMVLFNAILFTVISLTRWRQKLIAAFPESIKLGMQCSIGIFIAWLGLKSGGLIVSDPSSFSRMASVAEPGALLTLFGLVLISVLLAMRMPGAFLAGIGLLTILGLFLRDHLGHTVTSMPTAIVAVPHFSTGLFFAFDFKGYFSKFLLLLPITVYFLLSEFFSATATIVGVTRRAGLTTVNGDVPNSLAAFTSDAFSSVLGAVVGTSTVTAYVESVAGVEAGARTGLSGVVVALLFCASLFFAPFLAIIPPQATAPVLVLVGVLMMEGVTDIDVKQSEHAIPPLLMMIVTVCTADLMAGVAIGCFVHTAILIAKRSWKRLTPMILCLDAVFVMYLALKPAVA